MAPISVFTQMFVRVSMIEHFSAMLYHRATAVISLNARYLRQTIMPHRDPLNHGGGLKYRKAVFELIRIAHSALGTLRTVSPYVACFSGDASGTV